jgi:hypothetical protein
MATFINVSTIITAIGGEVEHRVRLDTAEVDELRIALLKHIRDLADERKGSFDRFILLKRLYYRLSRLLKEAKPGAPAHPLIFPSSEDKMYEDIKSWLKIKEEEGATP